MNSASISAAHIFRPQLLERRARLQEASGSLSADYFSDLIQEIDDALRKIDNGSYGSCETCHDPIEADRLERDPLVRFCLDHLDEAELQAHQQDLDLATQIQSTLLPPAKFGLENWDAHYRYQPAGAVGGDYCELIALPDRESLFFAVGDVAGKGVAASLLMTHLSAIFRSLLSLDLSLAEVISRANRLFCDSTAPAHYATLACGRASAAGVELCNAGHCPPLLLRRDVTQRFDSTGLPLGLFCRGQYGVMELNLDPGDTLVLYSDGMVEAQDAGANEYGEERLVQALRHHLAGNGEAAADRVLTDVHDFCGARTPSDDRTLLVLRRRS